MFACCNRGAFPVLYTGMLFNLMPGAGEHLSFWTFARGLSLIHIFRATQAYCNLPDKAITKANNLSVKAGSTNVTTNKGYVGVILLPAGNQGSPSSPAEWLLPAAVWAGKAQL